MAVSLIHSWVPSAKSRARLCSLCIHLTDGGWMEGRPCGLHHPEKCLQASPTCSPPFTFPLTQLGQSPATSHAEERAARPGAGRVESLVLQGI